MPDIDLCFACGWIGLRFLIKSGVGGGTAISWIAAMNVVSTPVLFFVDSAPQSKPIGPALMYRRMVANRCFFDLFYSLFPAGE
jgi:hypothetical protein